MRIECPTCATSYTPERCGVAVDPGAAVALTVRCVVCLSEFDAQITPPPALTWAERVLLLKTPADPTITTQKREVPLES